MQRHLIPTAMLTLLACVFGYASDNLYEARKAADPRVVYQNVNLTGVDFPIGPFGGSLIRMNGQAERTWWQIFHNYEQREGSG